MELITSKICMASDIGIHGNLFGGFLMAWIDEAAAAYVTQFCETPRMVTLLVSELMFKMPVKTGNHIKIYGQMISLGKTSATVKIEVRRLNVETTKEEIITTASLKFVRIDEHGKAAPISEHVRKKMN